MSRSGDPSGAARERPICLPTTASPNTPVISALHAITASTRGERFDRNCSQASDAGRKVLTFSDEV